MWRDVLILLALGSPAMADPAFRSVEIPPHSYTGGWEHFVGGGLAGFDCDGDGLLELFAAGGASASALFRNRSGEEVSFVKDTPAALSLTGVTGTYPLDIDGDGWLDLVVLRAGENLLLQGTAECEFAPFDDLGFVSGDRWTTAFAAMWEDGQTLPTLAFGNYVDRKDPEGPFRACDDNFLYRPSGLQYERPLPLQPGHCPLSMMFHDWDRSGQPALRISNDRHYYVDAGQEQMWEMADTPRLFSAADGWQAHKLWGMGVAARDLDRDGRDEVFMTSMGDQRLQRLSGADGPSYEDVPFDMGTTAHRPYLGGDGRPSTGWHVAFGDVQNDGRDDIFISKGNVEQMPDAAMDDPNSLLVQQADGTFIEAGGTAGVASMHRGRGAVLADLNGDGLLDLAVLNRRAPLEVWQNVSADAGHWLSVDLRQSGPNTRAVGAWIELNDGNTVQTREITVGGGHAGGVAGPVHFGLGSAQHVKVRVIWPDGTVGDWQEVEADQALLVQR